MLSQKKKRHFSTRYRYDLSCIFPVQVIIAQNKIQEVFNCARYRVCNKNVENIVIISHLVLCIFRVAAFFAHTVKKSRNDEVETFSKNLEISQVDF